MQSFPSLSFTSMSRDGIHAGKGDEQMAWPSVGLSEPLHSSNHFLIDVTVCWFKGLTAIRLLVHITAPAISAPAFVSPCSLIATSEV